MTAAFYENKDKHYVAVDCIIMGFRDNELHILIAKKIISDKVVFYGPIAHENLKSFYDVCDCLVLPSINNLETFGIVQAEAMICGVPVVASNLPGVRVPVQMTGMGEICKIKDSVDLGKKIELVLNNGKKYYQQRAKNLELFDYKKTIDSYERLILLDGRKQ